MLVAAVPTGANYPTFWVSLFMEGGVLVRGCSAVPCETTVSETEGEKSRPTLGDFVDVFHHTVVAVKIA